MAAPMQRLAATWRGLSTGRDPVEMLLIHQPSRAGSVGGALAPGVKALPWPEFLSKASG
jgi:hypothetical protein